jgi:mRNA interferase HigB
MRLLGKPKLLKLRRKNIGNKKLVTAIDDLIEDIEQSDWKNSEELKSVRPDADLVHNDGFYFFNINVHRTMILIEFNDGEATVVWVGHHDAYEKTFKNNKNTIARWLGLNDYIA